jgi:hypothetical protein
MLQIYFTVDWFCEFLITILLVLQEWIAHGDITSKVKSEM